MTNSGEKLLQSLLVLLCAQSLHAPHYCPFRCPPPYKRHNKPQFMEGNSDPPMNRHPSLPLPRGTRALFPDTGRPYYSSGYNPPVGSTTSSASLSTPTVTSATSTASKPSALTVKTPPRSTDSLATKNLTAEALPTTNTSSSVEAKETKSTNFHPDPPTNPSYPTPAPNGTKVTIRTPPRVTDENTDRLTSTSITTTNATSAGSNTHKNESSMTPSSGSIISSTPPHMTSVTTMKTVTSVERPRVDTLPATTAMNAITSPVPKMQETVLAKKSSSARTKIATNTTTVSSSEPSITTPSATTKAFSENRITGDATNGSQEVNRTLKEATNLSSDIMTTGGNHTTTSTIMRRQTTTASSELSSSSRHVSEAPSSSTAGHVSPDPAAVSSPPGNQSISSTGHGSPFPTSTEQTTSTATSLLVTTTESEMRTTLSTDVPPTATSLNHSTSAVPTVEFTPHLTKNVPSATRTKPSSSISPLLKDMNSVQHAPETIANEEQPEDDPQDELIRELMNGGLDDELPKSIYDSLDTNDQGDLGTPIHRPSRRRNGIPPRIGDGAEPPGVPPDSMADDLDLLLTSKEHKTFAGANSTSSPGTPKTTEVPPKRVTTQVKRRKKPSQKLPPSVNLDYLPKEEAQKIPVTWICRDPKLTPEKWFESSHRKLQDIVVISARKGIERALEQLTNHTAKAKNVSLTEDGAPRIPLRAIMDLNPDQGQGSSNETVLSHQKKYNLTEPSLDRSNSTFIEFVDEISPDLNITDVNCVAPTPIRKNGKLVLSIAVRNGREDPDTFIPGEPLLKLIKLGGGIRKLEDLCGPSNQTHIEAGISRDEKTTTADPPTFPLLPVERNTAIYFHVLIPCGLLAVTVVALVGVLAIYRHRKRCTCCCRSRKSEPAVRYRREQPWTVGIDAEDLASGTRESIEMHSISSLAYPYNVEGATNFGITTDDEDEGIMQQQATTTFIINPQQPRSSVQTTISAAIIPEQGQGMSTANFAAMTSNTSGSGDAAPENGYINTFGNATNLIDTRSPSSFNGTQYSTYSSQHAPP